MKQIRLAVRDIFCGVLKDDFSGVDIIHRDETPRWDSLKHVELIFALEDEFDLQFTESELEELKSEAQVITKIERINAT
jgi:acyl carrier protein